METIRHDPPSSDSLADLTTADADAMDVVLSLVPELRYVSAVVAYAARTRDTYPILTSERFAGLLLVQPQVEVEGGVLDVVRLCRHVPEHALPISDPVMLARAALEAINRCRQHEHLRLALAAFEEQTSAIEHFG
ncbi:hypothetical protein [uncultured Microbacterium sp.]|uniref:hypothetical protein n=1 Tax=uncultured Microbacterium sp. TaxID=191216 RepID=UPI00262AB4F3|nr:hypothetical protein [uncultured Microbacterium sp.]